jgi:hypothetical protein
MSWLLAVFILIAMALIIIWVSYFYAEVIEDDMPGIYTEQPKEKDSGKDGGPWWF